MSDRNTLILGAIVGAAVGVGVSYLVFTERGRRLRAEMQPEIETLVREAVKLGSSVDDLRRGRSGRSGPARGAGAPAAWPRRAT